MKKRGQITIFVIVGLIILLTLIFLVYFRKETVFRPEQIEPEFLPVKDYVETCMKTVAYDGLVTQGYNGGYLTFTPQLLDNPFTSLNPTGAPGSPFRNPYWWYDGTEAIPTQEFMEKQLSDHVEANIVNCLKSFDAFRETYNFIELGGFSANVEFGQADNSLVTVESVYPFVITDKFNKTLGELKDFKAVIPVRMHRLYTVAKNIMEFENKDPFIEQKVIDLIAMADEERIPTTGLEIDCGKKRWLIDDVESYLKYLMSVNFDFIKVAGTKYSDTRYIKLPNNVRTIVDGKEVSTTPDDRFNESYYNYHYVWAVPGVDPNMRIGFKFMDNWPMDLKIRPSNGRYLESNSQKGQEIARFLCIQLWHYTYDMIFPVMVTLVDEATRDHEEFSFQFAFKGSIDHNMPARKSFAFESFEGKEAIPNEEYCNDLYYEQVIYAIQDVFGGKEIRGVNFTFKCGKFSCQLGDTQPVYTGGAGGVPMFKALTPYCVQAVLEASKPGYKTAKTFINTDKSRVHEIYMSPVTYVKNYTVVKHKPKNFESYAPYPPDSELPLELLDKDDFEYELQIFLTKNDTLLGGYMQNWTVNQFDLNKEKVVFHVLYTDTKDEEEQYFFFGGLKSYSKDVTGPEFR
ncbi:MAG: hypothetical protein KJ601_05620 [Nanoarchaeota archaeon]|nr:hypothetical protein [Nanoarchaeota archaeon]